MGLELLWWGLAIAMIVVGFVGNLVPLLPGMPLMLAGMVLGAWVDHFSKVGIATLALLGFLVLLGQLADFVAGSLGAKRAGASGKAVWGATLGSLVGVLGGLPGIVLGPFIGAAIGEYLAERDLLRAGKVGVAAWLGLVLGMAAKIALAFTILGVFGFALLV
ncbi:DUF456 family protein [Chitinivorax sp. PXF-14]|uniref:DUF456 domain-containing protein n=1 Tax=Chitinivorax sp. PXF-14 TaxID=3230488 RepID=UPI003466EA4B